MKFQEHSHGCKTIEIVHGEAFQLMRYGEKNGEKEQLIWNSRDDVTPFIIHIDGIE